MNEYRHRLIIRWERQRAVEGQPNYGYESVQSMTFEDAPETVEGLMNLVINALMGKVGAEKKTSVGKMRTDFKGLPRGRKVPKGVQ